MSAARDATCDRCGSSDEVTDVTVTDESGGSFVTLCGHCVALAKATRCCLCGQKKAGRHKAEHVFLDSPKDSHPICDDCRRELVFEPVAHGGGDEPPY